MNRLNCEDWTVIACFGMLAVFLVAFAGLWSNAAAHAMAAKAGKCDRAGMHWQCGGAR